MESTTTDAPGTHEIKGGDFASVENVCRDSNVFMVHKVVPRFIEPDTRWTLLREGETDPSVLAKIVVAVGPDISCSTISEGDTPENFFGEQEGIGLLINRGQIIFAGASDSFTEFNENESKVQDRMVDDYYELGEDERGDTHTTLTPFAKRMLGSEVKSEEDIKVAIKARRKSTDEVHRYPFTTFNELVVRDPKVAALFTVLKDYGVRGDSDFDNYMRRFDPEKMSFLIDDIEAGNMESVRLLASDLDIPGLIFYRGKFYRIDKVEQVEASGDQYRDKRAYLGDQVSVEEALGMPDPLHKDPAKRSKLKKEIYQAKPFRDSNVLRLQKG